MILHCLVWALLKNSKAHKFVNPHALNLSIFLVGGILPTHKAYPPAR